MSKPSKYAAIELFSEPTTTGGANTNDWVASMRGMMLMYADAWGMQTAQQQSEDDFENHMAATLDINEPNAGTWDQLKAKHGL
jgi:hypothetical protein